MNNVPITIITGAVGTEFAEGFLRANGGWHDHQLDEIREPDENDKISDAERQWVELLGLEGFALKQALPIIQAAYRNYHDVLVRQPEIGLHPRQMLMLTDLFIHASGADGGSPVARKSWVIETQSETLFLRIRRRIRAGVIKPDDIRVLYLLSEKERENLETTRRYCNLRLSRRGNFLDDWPSGFFEERYKETFDEDED